MTDDLFELASAYLDGEATPDERARVEADPELSALVTRLRGVSAAVRDVPDADPAARERAIAAALSIPEVAASDAEGGGTPVVVPLRRPRTGRLLSYAAAVLVVGVLGLVAVAGLRNGGTDDSVADAPAEEAPASAELVPTDDLQRDTESGDGSGDAELFATEAAPDDAADGDAGDSDAGDGGADLESPTPGDDPADNPADDPADVVADDPADDDTAETSNVIDLATLTDTELAALLAEVIDAGRADASADRRCAAVLDIVVEPADGGLTYAGAPALLGSTGDKARVVDPTDCAVLVEIPLEHSTG